MKAIWFPYWYALDQSIELGAENEFDFFKVPPDYVVSEGLTVFYHGDWSDRSRSLFERKKIRITAIRHPVLGDIKKIETDGLDYTMHLADGRVLKVEAEETPGVVYGLPPIQDWRIFVEFDPA